MKGFIMTNHQNSKNQKVEVPGLDYFTPETARPAKVIVRPQRAEVAALDQMYGYFAD